MEVKNPQECENMQDIRLAIDQLDKIIVETIARRAQYVHAAAKFKKNEADVKDENRVKKVIDSKMTLARENNVSPKLIGQIYEMMINHFINEEMSEWKSQ